MSRLLALVSLAFVAACEHSGPENSLQPPISVTRYMGSTPAPGFARVLKPREFHFPQDHGAHPDYATEWWYFTGNLRSDGNHRLGYQLTLFRIGLDPAPSKGDSNWRSHQIFMGHLALSDIDRHEHISDERFARSAAGLAGAENMPLKIWLGSWSIQGGADDNIFPLRLRADTPEITIDLVLQSGDKAVILQGDRGFSRKGAAPGNASYYYSYTRLPTTGAVRWGDRRMQVVGNSWFDREWSSSALAKDQVGWDWFALQLDDGRDLMFYRMRDIQGKAQKFSRGVLVSDDGDVTTLSPENTLLEAVEYWRSADSIRYPLRWQLAVADEQINLTIDAAFEDQEMQHSVRYWEGAVRVTGSHTGVGYLELSGYIEANK